MSFLHEKDRMGAALYDTSSECLRVTSIPVNDADLPWMCALLKEHAGAHLAAIVVSSRIDDAVKEELSKANVGDAAYAGAIPVRVAKHATFSVDTARRLLGAVADPDGAADDGAECTPSAAPASSIRGAHIDRLPSLIDANDPMMLRAAGGLLSFLLRNGIVNEMEDEGEPIQLNGGVRMFSLRDFMQMDTGTYLALNIFATEDHPSLIKTTGKAKEGFSLFALLDRTVTTAGRRLLRAWCQKPSMDVDIIKHRQDTVEFLVRLRSQLPEVFEEIKKLLKQSKDVARCILRLKRVRASAADWVGLQRTILSATMLRDTLSRCLQLGGARIGEPSIPSEFGPEQPFIIWQIVREFSPELVRLQAKIDDVIDWAGTKSARRVVVRPGVDPALDDYRTMYAELPDVLGERAVEQLTAYPTLHSLGVQYLPQIGCVLVVDRAVNAELLKESREEGGDGLVFPDLPDDFEPQFQSMEALYFKNPAMHELDATYGDIAAAIHDAEAAIVRRLEEDVLDQEGLILTVGLRLAELDVLASFAEVALDYKYVRPNVVEDNVLLVKGGRHPLQEITVETFVPNDIALGANVDGVGSVAIITGANSSGKSVYLKMVGLLPVMAQIGCFVPAEKAVVGLVDRLFTRIQSAESISANQSTFALDVHQIGLMLRHASPRSLLLIDEFGKGTSSLDGVALLAASIRHLLRGVRSWPRVEASPSGPVPPKTIITTHFREVFDHDLLEVAGPDGEVIQSKQLVHFHMNVMLERTVVQRSEAPAGAVQMNEMETTDEPGSARIPSVADAAPEWDDSVVPLFRLVPGRAANSYGLACAKQAGIPNEVVERAHGVMQQMKLGTTIMPLSAAADTVSRAERAAQQLRAVSHLLRFAAALDGTSFAGETAGVARQAEGVGMDGALPATPPRTAKPREPRTPEEELAALLDLLRVCA